MGWQTLREAVPTAVMHMATAAVHLMAAAALGGSLATTYTAFVAVVLLVAPALAVLSMLGGAPRAGSLFFVGSFVGTAVLAIYGYLGLGLLPTALDAPASPWKTLFFVTAMLLPLLQVTGILEATRMLTAQRESRPRLANKSGHGV